MRRLFAIPDIHGRVDLLLRLMNKLQMDQTLDLSRDKLIFLGDMVDRGPNSMDVIGYIRALKFCHPDNVVVLAGNHEWLMIDGLTKGFDAKQLWMWNGGGATINSFLPDEIHTNITSWMMDLPLYHEEPGFFFSHAPQLPEEHRKSQNKGRPFTKDELIWTYEHPEDLYARNFGDKVGVCGHIHALPYRKEPRLYPHYIFADAGCGCHPEAPLVAIEVVSRTVISVSGIPKEVFDEQHR